MKFDFVKIDEAWRLILDSKHKIIEYHSTYFEPKLAKGAINYIKNKHPTSDFGEMIASYMLIFPDLSLPEVVMKISKKSLESKISIFEKYGDLFVNSNSGYTPNIEIPEDAEILSNSVIIFPKEHKPRFLQWVSGGHWYVKVGSIDVVVDGKQKWNTRKEAKEAHKKWL